MSVQHILNCIRKCNDPQAMDELAALAGLYQRLYTFMVDRGPGLGEEHRWRSLYDDLRDVGTQLVKFLGG